MCPKKRPRAALGLIALASAAVLVGLIWLAANSAEEPAAPAPKAPAEQSDPTPEAPAEQTPDAAAWKPPVFTERSDEREALASNLQRVYGFSDAAVLDAVRSVPRHEFVPEGVSRQAYDDTPLPIGYGQTISQPFIVAEMTRLLALKPDSKVLEIGTGSGYQAAVLTEFAPHVYSVEIIPQLADSAAKRLERLGYAPVKVKEGDGYYGWAEHAPFDAIIVTCAAGQIPPPLMRQLAPGGRMVIPVGPVHAVQSLMLVEKDEDGTTRSRSLMAVQFVPLVRRPEGRE